MSDSAQIEKTITHYNAAKVFLIMALGAVNIATVALVIYSVLLLVDCTTPTGECAKRGQQQTQEALKQIARHDEVVTFCANRPGNDTLIQLRACIEKEIK